MRRVFVAVGWLVVLVLLSEIYSWPSVLQRRGYAGQKANHIFVDGGGHIGETVNSFFETVGCSLLPWRIYSFEANPELISKFQTHPRLTVLNQAILDRDEPVDFFFGRQDDGGSVLGNKNNVTQNKVTVPAIDFSAWLAKNVSPSDFVWVKLDIEGAEYAVLEKVLKDGNAGLIDQLSLEYHDISVGVPVARDEQLTAALEAKGVTVFAGDAYWFRPAACWPWSICSLGWCGNFESWILRQAMSR